MSLRGSPAQENGIGFGKVLAMEYVSRGVPAS